MTILFEPLTGSIVMPSGISGYADHMHLGSLTTDLAKETLEHRGHIYTAKHEGWYSVSDETFYPNSQVQNSLDPATGRKRMVRYGPELTPSSFSPVLGIN